MRVKVKITDMTVRQFQALDVVLKDSYEFDPDGVRVCAVFELAPQSERHVELPRAELDQALRLLELVERGAVAEAVLTDTERPHGRAVV